MTNVGTGRSRRLPTAVSDELLNFEWQTEPGHARGTLNVGPELGNRVGHVQGGALFGAAAAAAEQAVGVPEARLLDGHYQFLRPADGQTLAASGELLRRGRRGAYAQARLSMEGRLVGIGLFGFRL